MNKLKISLNLGGPIMILQILFIVLKLCNVISWSWPIVLLPLLISVGVFLVVILLLAFIWLGWIINQ